MSKFSGFEMPMWYSSITAEHLAVRRNVGLFDVSHMGRVLITGPGAEALLDHVTTNDVSALAPLRAHYSLMCNETGGIIDDFVLSKLEDEKFLMVYNASNRNVDFQWLARYSRSFNVKVEDVSNNIAMFALQGPKAESVLQNISNEDLRQVQRFECGWTKLAGVRASISRTGYTGEDGFEVFVWETSVSSPSRAEKVWSTVLEAGRQMGIEPCGLGSRDTLRLEAGMCLRGNDIDEGVNPFEARLGFVVKLKKKDFLGKDALVDLKSQGLRRKRVGINLLDRGIPRQHCEIWRDGRRVGTVTSGTFSPLLKRGIAMAYISKEYATEGEIILVKIRNRLVKAEVAKFPLYDARRYGFRRES